ncbi:pra1 family protein [Anaeramoeba ignava]|uniref:PRA1 family protein n=1 Tax=Anaeramoeba ignava TaxID=1746090 RepID=A0A9Q0LFJ6_ANAIG|nr:pra1 family protein [Anaeramoeba ignava]|eukprot:Anaeramoba_ignava/a356720_19.p1 GENE.a356720_19~~a356720_19.p1  ORF type:complete len:147 (+),score=37.12 a356720_19:33-473(+)
MGLKFHFRSMNEFIERFNLPPSLEDAYKRLKIHLEYFSGNYLIILSVTFLLILFMKPVAIFTPILPVIFAYYTLVMRKGEYLDVAGVQLGKVHFVLISFGSFLLMLLIFSSLRLTFFMIIGMLVVLGHASFRNLSKKARIATGIKF